MDLGPQRRYRLLLSVTNAIINQTSRDGLFQVLAEETRRLFHYDRFSINLYDERTDSLTYFATADGVAPAGISDRSRPLAKGAIAQAVIRSGQPLVIPDLSQRTYWPSVQDMMAAGLVATMAFPLVVRDHVLGSLHFSFKHSPEKLDELTDFLRELAAQVAIAVDNMLAHAELKAINESLEEQKRFLLLQTEELYGPDQFFFVSRAMRDVMRQVEMIAATDASVLVTGETGTGKDHVARYVHRLGPRRDAMFVKVNCPALSPGLFESELFGHARGAFTGAHAQRAGRFEMASGGTVFLDEIGELSPELQAKLLHVLQDRAFERVGESRSIEVDFRVIAATNRDLERCIREGEFRSDLYYRINTVKLHIPPLRERRDDIPLLVERFTAIQASELRRPPPRFTGEALAALARYPWPGNVRELKNLVRRMTILRPGRAIDAPEVEGLLGGEYAADKPRPLPTLAQAERQHLAEVLARTGGVVAGPLGAAAVLGVPRSTLMYRLKKHNLNPRSFQQAGNQP